MKEGAYTFTYLTRDVILVVWQVYKQYLQLCHASEVGFVKPASDGDNEYNKTSPIFPEEMAEET